MVKVKLIDDSVRTFLLDTSSDIAEVVADICDKLGFEHREEYGLMNEGDKDRWLEDDKTLIEQGWEEDSVVILRQKFFAVGRPVYSGDEIMEIRGHFLHARANILSGASPIVRDEAIQLTSILLQVEQSDFSPQRAVLEILEWREVLPRNMWQEEGLDKDIEKAWLKLRGMTEISAKLRYVTLYRTFETWIPPGSTVKSAAKS